LNHIVNPSAHQRHMIMLPPLIGSARPIVTLNSLSLLFWNHNISCLYMDMSDFKDNHRNPSELSHDPSLLVFAAKSWVSSDWLMSSSKLQPCLELCRFAQALFKTKVVRWKAHFLLGICEKTLVQHLSERMAYYSRYTTGKKGVALGVL
jgi:hypothetical protein